MRLTKQLLFRKLCLTLLGLVLATSMWAQQTVSGVIKDDTGETVPGVSIIAKGSTVGTISDVKGAFTLQVPEGVTTLVFSFVGLKTQEIDVAGKSKINVSMQTDAIGLDEVVAVGYGSMKKSDLTGALSSVNASDFEAQPLTKIDQALQGRASGVQVTQTSGAPGAGYKIRIRGANSLTQGNSPLYVIDGQFLSDLNSINVNDIETMEVLKDASATAIYGSRGANGVVLITTRKGKVGKAKINMEGFYGVSNVTQNLPVMSPGEFARGVNYAEGSEFFTEQEISDLDNGGGENWQDRLFRPANSYNAQLSISGGTDKMDYFVSGGYTDIDGTIESTNYKRYTFRNNLNLKLGKRVKVGFNSQLGYRKDEGVRANLATGLTWDPTTPAYNENGELNLFPLKPGVGNGYENPLARPKYNENIDKQTSILMNGFLNVDIWKGLVFRTSVGLEYYGQNDQAWNSIQITSGKATYINGNRTNLQNTNRLSYVWDTNPNHRLSIDAVHEQIKNSRQTLNSSVSNFDSDTKLHYRPQDGEVHYITNAIRDNSMQSALARVNYSLMEKYMFTASYRADGSSRFAEGQKWGYFPSASFAWRVIEEGFMQNQNIFNNLKLRVGYGLTGNDQVPDFAPFGVAEADRASGYPFTNDAFTVGVAASDVAPNPNLTWETTAQTNAGIDVGFWNSRANISIDYYYKLTSDLLLKQQLPAQAGPSARWINAGELENKGFDITLALNLVKNGDWDVNTSLTVSRNKNKVLELVDGLQTIELGNEYIGNTFDVNPTRVEVGKSMSTFRGYKFLGTWKTSEADEAAKYKRKPGEAKYADLNENGEYDTGDITTVGEGVPDFTWGWNWSASYRNWDLNALFTGSHGNDIYNFTRMRMMGLGAQQFHAVHADYNNRWTAEKETDIPNTRDNTEELSSQFIEKGSFVTLKNISLGYNFDNPFKGFDLIRLYVSAENLFIITDYRGFDPEATASGGSDVDLGIDYNAYPLNKTFTVGVKANF